MRKLAKYLVRNLFPHWWYMRKIRYLSPDEKEIALLPMLVDADKMAIDIGANLGLYVHNLVKITTDVVAFEPIAEMRAMITGEYGGRVQLHAVALADKPGTATLRMRDGDYARATIARTNTLNNESGRASIRSYDVPVRTLDEYDFRSVGFIKIDVEGHEERVLDGAAKTIAREMPNLLIEVEERHNPGSVARVAEAVCGLGYQCLFYRDGALHPYEEFDLIRDQDVKFVDGPEKAKYINNFIFVPRDQAARLIRSSSRPVDAAP